MGNAGRQPVWGGEVCVPAACLLLGFCALFDDLMARDAIAAPSFTVKHPCKKQISLLLLHGNGFYCIK